MNTKFPSEKKNNKQSFNSMPRFVWGMSVNSDGKPDERESLLHTRYPRFIASVYEDLDQIAESEYQVVAYGSLRFFNFIFLDGGKVEKHIDAVDAVIEDAVKNWKIYQGSQV